jgi:hypothetical protein
MSIFSSVGLTNFSSPCAATSEPIVAQAGRWNSILIEPLQGRNDRFPRMAQPNPGAALNGNDSTVFPAPPRVSPSYRLEHARLTLE